MKKTTLFITILLLIGLNLIHSQTYPDLETTWLKKNSTTKLILKQNGNSLTGYFKGATQRWDVSGSVDTQGVITLKRKVGVNELRGTPEIVLTKVKEQYGDRSDSNYLLAPVRLHYNHDSGVITGYYVNIQPVFRGNELLRINEVKFDLVLECEDPSEIVTIKAPGGLRWSKKDEDNIEICIGKGSSTNDQGSSRSIILTAKNFPEKDIVIREDTKKNCVTYKMVPAKQEGIYVIKDETGKERAQWKSGRYVIGVKVLTKTPKRYRLPGNLDIKIHPPVRIEVYDKNTNQIIISKDNQKELGRIVQDKEFRIRVLDSPFIRNTPDTVKVTVKGSEETLEHDLPRREHAGKGVNVWEHMKEYIAAKYIEDELSSNHLEIPRDGDNLTITALGRTVKLRVARSNNWKTAEIILAQLKELHAFYQIMIQNPNITPKEKAELLAKEGLVNRAIYLHGRGDVTAYLLITASKKYMQLLRMNKSQLGSFDSSRTIDPSRLPDGMRETPVVVPYKKEEEYFYLAKQEAGRMLGREFRAATIESIGAVLGIPQMILDVPKQIAESINILYRGKNLKGEWASSDDKLYAAVDLGGLALGPLMKGLQALKPSILRKSRLIDLDEFKTVKKAQDALGMPNMSCIQAQKIIQAHQLGRPPYSMLELRKKMKLATRAPPKGAGLTAAQADKLARLGIIGRPFPEAFKKLPKKRRDKYHHLTKKKPVEQLSKDDCKFINKLREDIGDTGKLDPGTPEHKAARWQEYRKRTKQGKTENWKYDRWQKQYNRNMDNWKRGLDDQKNALKKLGIDNNDLNHRFEFEVGDDVTRPDAVTNKAIIECKSMSVRGPPSERVLYFDKQLDLQKKAAGAKSSKNWNKPIDIPKDGRKFAVIMVSENRKLVRPSRNLANPKKGADLIYHRNPKTGKWSVWVPEKQRWKGVKAKSVADELGGTIN